VRALCARLIHPSPALRMMSALGAFRSLPWRSGERSPHERKKASLGDGSAQTSIGFARVARTS